MAVNEIITRNPYNQEIPFLKQMWEDVFGSDAMESFFSNFYSGQHTIIAEHDGKPAAMGYLIEMGQLRNGLTTYPCAMLYAIATVSEHRGKGLGTAVVNRLITTAFKSGYDAVVLCPAADSLFDYYSYNTDFCDWFYTGQKTISSVSSKKKAGRTQGSAPMPLIGISSDEYCNLRETLLDNTVHIKLDVKYAQYQKILCDEFGGGLYKAGNSCAIIEVRSVNSVCVVELLTDKQDNESDIVSAISDAFPGYELTCRYPVKREQGKRFGMLTLRSGSPAEITVNTVAPWYGPAFD